ncbi:MAG: DNA-directed RNA polymerase subunit H [Candidatus Woesearchaeota archaeon]
MVEQIQHALIPKHEKISNEEKQQIFEKYNITFKELPKIPLNDPAIRHLDAKVGDIIKITRKSPTAGRAIFFRGVSRE